MIIVYIVIGKRNVSNVKIKICTEIDVIFLVVNVQEMELVKMMVYAAMIKMIAVILLIQEINVQYYVLIYLQIVKHVIEMKLVLRVLITHYLEKIVLMYVIIVLMDFVT